MAIVRVSPTAQDLLGHCAVASTRSPAGQDLTAGHCCLAGTVIVPLSPAGHILLGH